MTNLLDNMSAIGILLLGSGGGIRFLVSGAKIFAKDVLPMLRQQKDPEHDGKCALHDSICETLKQLQNSKEVLIRIETKLETVLESHSEHSRNIEELFNRLRVSEKDIAVIQSKDHNNITSIPHSKGRL